MYWIHAVMLPTQEFYIPEGDIKQYTALAQAALDQGDRVLAETYYQHADHVLRLMNEAKENSPTSVVDAHRNPEASASRTDDFETLLAKDLTKA
jgi:hypothetical protein